MEANKETPDLARFNDTLMKYYHLIGDVENLAMHRDSLDGKITEDLPASRKEGQYDLFLYSINRTKGRESSYTVALHLAV